VTNFELLQSAEGSMWSLCLLALTFTWKSWCPRNGNEKNKEKCSWAVWLFFCLRLNSVTNSMYRVNYTLLIVHYVLSPLSNVHTDQRSSLNNSGIAVAPNSLSPQASKKLFIFKIENPVVSAGNLYMGATDKKFSTAFISEWTCIALSWCQILIFFSFFS
jgi:hypothetical protein